MSRVEKRVLLAGGAAAIAAFLFVVLAGEVVEGDTASLDRRLLLALRTPGDPTDPLGPAWLEEMMRDFTALGGVGVLTLMTIVVAAFLALTRKGHAAVAVLAAIASGLILSSLLKYGFSRPRPDLVPHGSVVVTSSFPSGHAMMSAIVYLTLAVMLARTQARIRVRIFILIVAALLTLLVGVSRVYLGVHWPSDVLGGWALGSAWAIACWAVILYLQEAGQIEREVDEENGDFGQGGA